jgi:uncharacterized protein
MGGGMTCHARNSTPWRAMGETLANASWHGNAKRVLLTDRSLLNCLFASDLHGSAERYTKLWQAVQSEQPAAVFLGGDLLPSGLMTLAGDSQGTFVREQLVPQWSDLRQRMSGAYPRIFVILGNDDARAEETELLEAQKQSLIEYVACRKVGFGPYEVLGYPYVPPTPFLNKDWERYDVSRYVDPGCVAPEDGYAAQAPPCGSGNYATIQAELAQLAGDLDLSHLILVAHSPPYQTALDRAALDGKMIDHCPLDVHVGSIAIRRFIEKRQPLLTLHGHVHESARLTGRWQDRIGRTVAMSAAHDGPELALVRFDPDDLQGATRELIGWT